MPPAIQPHLPTPGPAQPLLHLQRTIGNRAVTGLIQTKLKLGQPGDRYEQEADRVAGRVMRMPEPYLRRQVEPEEEEEEIVQTQPPVGQITPLVQRQVAEEEAEEEGPLQPQSPSGQIVGHLVQRKCAACASGQGLCPNCAEEENEIQRKPLTSTITPLIQRQDDEELEDEEETLRSKAASGQTPTVTADVQSHIQSLQDGGQPLPETSRTFFESRFNHDFSQVRTHKGAQATEAARAVNARAFTIGQDVVFGAGQYAPGTTVGDSLLAHELTHVVQQTSPLSPSLSTIQRQAAPPSAAIETATERTEEIATPGLIVEDTATELGPGQMKKSEFLAELRSQVCNTAEAAMAGTGRTTDDCPYLDYWFDYYNQKDSQHVERAIRRYAPETSAVTAARDYIPIITERVRRGVEVWARTGEITGVPEGVPTELPGTAPAERSEGPVATTGNVQFKARDGEARSASDPQAIQAQLSTGHPLEGGVKSRMESAFGTSFSHVRVHTDAGAAGLSSRFNARAFTVGENVAFGAGEYQPGTLIGDALIAHELAHVVQQGGADAPVGPMRYARAADHSLEADADFSVMRAMFSLWTGAQGALENIMRNAMPRLKSGLKLQRCTCDRSEETRSLTSVTGNLPNFTCSPSPVTLSEIAKIPNLPNGVLGVTKVSDFKTRITTVPAFFKWCSLRIDEEPQFGMDRFIYTQDGTYDLNETETPTRGRCRHKTLAKKLKITKPMADKIKEGEIEHCEDARQAWSLSFDKYVQVYKEFTSRYCADGSNCEDEFKSRFKALLGIDYDSRSSVARCLFDKSDERDTKGWHSVVLRNPSFSRDCKTATYTPSPGDLQNVGKVSSQDLVKDCGES